jgi:hypothetical protein
MTTAVVIDANVHDALAPLLARASHDATHELGPIHACDFDRAATEIRWAAADLLARGYDVQADAALTLADRLDETAELAHLLQAAV